MRTEKIFAVLFPAQKKQIEEYCWGPKCGKGIVGTIDLDISAAVACRHGDCPILDKQMDEPMGTVGDQMVYLRKLTDV